MQIEEYKNIYQNEESHFFYITNHTIIINFIKKYLLNKKPINKILDAGCGTGLLAKKLSKFGEVTGIDISSEAIKYAKKRGIKVIKGSVDNLPFKENSFDAVTCMDVIYHKQVDDKKSLSEFYRVLKPGGILILRVPANKWLRLKHDQHVHTRERYSKQELANKLELAQFTLLKISYINSPLLPLAFLNQLRETLFKTDVDSSVGKISNSLNSFIAQILLIEAKIIPIIAIPFGLGIIAVAKKPQAIK